MVAADDAARIERLTRAILDALAGLEREVHHVSAYTSAIRKDLLSIQKILDADDAPSRLRTCYTQLQLNYTSIQQLITPEQRSRAESSFSALKTGLATLGHEVLKLKEIAKG